MSMIEIDWNPSIKKLRQFSGILFLGFGILGLIFFLGYFSPEKFSTTLAIGFWTVGTLAGTLGVLLPSWLRPVYFAWMGISYPIGWLMSHFLLALIYFGIFTPISLFFRLLGRDSLRRFNENKETYWIERSSMPESKRYFNQF